MLHLLPVAPFFLLLPTVAEAQTCAPTGSTCVVPCFEPGVCIDGSCETGLPIICAPSSDECVDSICNPASGACELSPFSDGTPCAGDDACLTGTSCLAGVCGGGDPVVCDQDSNVCTVDVCDSITGQCAPEFTQSLCDDGNLCSAQDQCVDGSCVAGSARDCDDGDACTAESCDALSGCINDPIPGCVTPPPMVPAGAFWVRGVLVLALIGAAHGAFRCTRSRRPAGLPLPPWIGPLE